MPFPIQTPTPTRELVRLLDIKGRYSPELEQTVLPVVALPLEDGFTVAISQTQSSGGASASGYGTLTRAEILALTAFAQPMGVRGWAEADVDLYLMAVDAAVTAASAANYSGSQIGVLLNGAELTLHAASDAGSIGDLIAGALEHFIPTRDSAGTTANLGWSRDALMPFLLPAGAQFLLKSVSNAGGAAVAAFTLVLRVVAKGHPARP